MTKKSFTKLSDSYVKHYEFTRKQYREKDHNDFHGFIDAKGTVTGTMINSFGNLSVLTGQIYRFLFLRLLIGRASGYPGYPNGAPYIKFAIVTPKRSYGILMGRRGFVYIRLKRTKITEGDA